ncbi:AraC family transcriptional regulator [Cupriavidus sp. SS-3]|uniref:AraC family transcriptional regulator n=1 Tax=Cupriavidus sp. SS-3 TaxID=3109596 RepID=UPI002DB6EE78|nr:AraC family transcriptional regulator [Cupriavidus sp. SS-3]MEC3766454.1 AraC family transcriptional regulator [Cupriavidus sp. SS-3]
MTVRKLDFRNPDHHASLFSVAPVRSSTTYDWKALYFERRDDALFQTGEHAIDGHYLMVKLNPLSIAERRIDGRLRTEVQRRGSTAYVPNGCGHSVRYVRPLGSLCLMTLHDCTLREVADELGVTGFAGVPTFAQAPDNFVLNAFEALDQELRNGNPHGALIGETYARLVAAHIVTCYGKGPRGSGRIPALTIARMKWLDEYIEAHLTHRITLEALARQAGLSPYYFTRVFKDATGLPPYRYVLHKRIEYACATLRRDELSIEDVALACGFGDNAQFTKQFKKICGVTPSAYRMACRQDEIAGIA